MQKEKEYLLWRVDWIHRNGYHAPFQLVEVKNTKRAKKDAHAWAKTQSLARFPKRWCFKLREM